MVALVRIEALEHSRPGVAVRIHGVQMAAYRQEAELVAAVRFPPLERTVEQLRSSTEKFFGAFAGDALAGVVAVERTEENHVTVSSLVVAPDRQRRGIGRELLAHVLGTNRSAPVRVETAARNTPAISLYIGLGFAIVRTWVVGSSGLELVRLSWSPSSEHHVA